MSLVSVTTTIASWAQLFLTWVSILAALASANSWFQSSQLQINPVWRPGEEPGEEHARHAGWIAGVLDLSMKSADLNARAARWAAIAAAALAFLQLMKL
ncbi:MAG: hypothetical protein KGJ03_06415 [Betaproteobacteria bacterium]|nr:hypothetical protein [Betaproteobacteria bacterium]MDE2153010.1 hypothetical protein [Betaproteobacteria bacterium]